MSAQQLFRSPVVARWAERVLFLVGLAILLHPVLSSRFYHTMDGPSHVYAASLLKDLLLGDAPADRVWELNPVPVPNSLGHVLLALLLIPLEAPEALKGLHLLYLVSIPVLLRLIALQRNPDAPPWAAHIGFAFAVCLPFAMGYYNLCLGVALLLAVIHQWDMLDRAPTRGRWVTLSILLILLYFSHAMPFVLALLWIALHTAQRVLEKFKHHRSVRAIDLYPMRMGVLSALPALGLLIWYMLASEPAPPPDGEYPFTSRWAQVWRPFVMDSFRSELILWAASVAIMLLAVLSGLGSRSSTMASAWRPGPGVIFLGALVLLLCFAKNVYGNGGDVLFRIAFVAHLSAVVLISSLVLPSAVGLWISMASLGIMVGQLVERRESHERHTRVLRETYETLQDAPSGVTASVVYFDWERAHAAELGLAGRGITVLSNYELDHDHFPVRFKLDYLRSAKALPHDPLDALFGSCTNARGAELKASSLVLVVGQPRNPSEQGLLTLLDHELSATHTIGSAKDLVRRYERMRTSPAR